MSVALPMIFFLHFGQSGWFNFDLDLTKKKMKKVIATFIV